MAIKGCFFVDDRWEKAVHRFARQLDVPVGYWICKMWTETQHFQEPGENNSVCFCAPDLVQRIVSSVPNASLCAPDHVRQRMKWISHSVVTSCCQTHQALICLLSSISRWPTCAGCQAAPLWCRPPRIRPYGTERFISCNCITGITGNHERSKDALWLQWLMEKYVFTL